MPGQVEKGIQNQKNEKSMYVVIVEGKIICKITFAVVYSASDLWENGSCFTQE